MPWSLCPLVFFLKISCHPFQGLTPNFLLAGSSSSRYRGWAEHSLMLFELFQRFWCLTLKMTAPEIDGDGEQPGIRLPFMPSTNTRLVCGGP